MLKTKVEAPDDLNPQETSEWVEALDEIIDQAVAGLVLPQINGNRGRTTFFADKRACDRTAAETKCATPKRRGTVAAAAR